MNLTHLFELVGVVRGKVYEVSFHEVSLTVDLPKKIYM